MLNQKISNSSRVDRRMSQHPLATIDRSLRVALMKLLSITNREAARQSEPVSVKNRRLVLITGCGLFLRRSLVCAYLDESDEKCFHS